MKTILLFVFLNIIIQARAQKWQIGFEVGKMETKTGGENLFPYLEMYGISGYHTKIKSYIPGIYLQSNFMKHFSIAWKFNYIEQGSDLYISKVHFTNNFGSVIATYDWYHKYRFNFISFTSLIKANYGKPVNVFLGVGPSYNLLTKATDETDTLDYSTLTVVNETINRKDDFSSFVIGASGEFGLGFILQNRISVSTGINFYWRLSDFKIDNYENENINFHSYFVRVQYLFGKNKE